MCSDLTSQEKPSIKSKAGDISKPQRGVYLHMIEGRDNTWRFYVGQSDNLPARIRRQHQNFRYRRDNPSFHYHALQNSRWDHFIVLAVLPPEPTAAGFSPKEQALLLNMLDMWCALLFCTLQPDAMAKWHLDGARAGAGRPWVGLNFACPLDEGEPVGYVDWRDVLSESEDPLARSYVVNVLDRRRQLTPGRESTPGPGLMYGLMVCVIVVCIISLSGSQGRPRAR